MKKYMAPYSAPHWYHQPWGILLIVSSSLAILAGAIFAVIVLQYRAQILSEQLPRTNTTSTFTAMKNSTTPTTHPTRADLEISHRPTLGSPSAPHTIVEFVDLKCPNCRTAEPIIRQVAARYGNTVKIIFRHFPIESLHPGASDLATLAYCAGEQGRYPIVEQLLFRDQDTLPEQITADNVIQIANEAGLDRTNLASCLKASTTQTEIQRDLADGIRFGVRGTPTFFLDGNKIEGVLPLENWEKILQSLP